MVSHNRLTVLAMKTIYRTIAALAGMMAFTSTALTIQGGTATSSFNGRLFGGYGRPFWFTVATPSPSNRVVGAVSTLVSYKDRVYQQDTVSTVTDYDSSVFYELDRLSPEVVTGTTSNSSVITSGTNLGTWTYQSSGTATITVSSASRTVTNTVVTSATTQVGRLFYSFGSGSVAANSSTFIDNALIGKSATNALALYSTRNDSSSTYVRNVNFWAASIDFSCSSVWNSSGGNLYGATLVSPRHVVFANHAPSMNGATLRFVTGSNSVVTRTVTAAQYATSDISVGILDSDVPAGITFATALASGTTKFAPPTSDDWVTYPARIPAVGFNQSKQGLVVDMVLEQPQGYQGADWNLTAFMTPVNAQRKAFNAPIIVGDSGSPIFLIVNTHPVLVTLWWYPNGGPTYRTYNTQVNSAMHTLSVNAGIGTNYQLTLEDLSGFTSY